MKATKFMDPDVESLSGATISATRNNTQHEKASTSTPVICSLDDQEGYDRLAEMMGKYPAGAVFRGFGTMNALNLLCYQAELAIIENDLKTAMQNDRTNDDLLRRTYRHNFPNLKDGRCADGQLDLMENTQWRTLLRMRTVVEQYNKAIIAVAQINQLARPSKGSLNLIKRWMSDNGNGSHVYLTGPDSHLWQNTPAGDMIALYAREYEDVISTWITATGIDWFDKLIGGRKSKNPLRESWLATTSVYSRKSAIRILSLLAITTASLCPIVSIIALNELSDNATLRLWMMAVFTVIFCVLFGLFTGARKTELLAASAAFAAVQVVFISGNPSPQSPAQPTPSHI
ncbi:hypothetical protein LTR66_015518 [Elasticomyces elasticus]|nr:hypothetical protein LTR66_015518 [Elasticomyces elasticus]